jgi:DNA-binding transcriptional LysR family regulator
LELRSLRYFIATADELHVGRAAEHLGIAQPALSQQIQSLEARLQVRLFDRAHRKIALTEPGRVFLAEARRLVAASDRAIRLARDAERGMAGELHIGYSGSVIFEPLICHLLRQFRATYPDVGLVMHESSVQEQLEALQAERLDIALLRGPLGVIPPGIAHRTVLRSRLVVALPADHPLAQRTTISATDLRSEPFVTLIDPPGIGLAHSIQLMFERAGFAPKIALRAGSVMSILGLVGAGLGVGILPELPLQFSSPTFVLRPLQDAGAWTEVALLTRKRTTSAVEMHFIAMANEEMKFEAVR